MDNINLSERESEILKLLGQGKSNKEIAQELFISINTVKVHLNNVFKKMGVSSRTEATVYAIEHKLIDSPLPEPEPVQVFVPIYHDREPERNKISTFLKQYWWATVIAVFALLSGLSFLVRSSNLFADSTPTSSQFLNALRQERWYNISSIPTPRTLMAIATWDNAIYTIGGHTNKGTSAVVERFTKASNRWETMAPKPTPVELASAAVVGGKIYVPGGQLGDGTLTNVLEVYDPRTDSWSSKTPLPFSLANYGISTYEGRLFVFGGWDGKSNSDSVLHYNTNTDRWEEMSTLPTARSGGKAITLGERIILVGGECNDGSCLSMEVYDPNQDMDGKDPWQQQMPLDSDIKFIGAQEVSGSLFVFGMIETGVYELRNYTPQNNSWYTYVEETDMLQTEQPQLISIGGEVYFLGGVDLNGFPSDKVVRYQAVFTIVLPQITN